MLCVPQYAAYEGDNMKINRKEIIGPIMISPVLLLPFAIVFHFIGWKVGLIMSGIVAIVVSWLMTGVSLICYNNPGEVWRRLFNPSGPRCHGPSE